ncbi:LutB/LldF family L-lactate oxidation iron-sulfur protein [Desulfopila sp. IMCC35008]|uniref:LutB/LldF family L-lactate oxidation iron-sulfur protein n=1 Tax=Desulfopila sp. IMCC35008 TaxID=2653858 RepID=UPI0013D4EA03|nr:LutB/LldF family L-lactate oxidation iron-sulfur protein [Desulfopila sp. IMCC35008]
MSTSRKSYSELAAEAIEDKRLKRNLNMIQEKIGKNVFAFWENEENRKWRDRVKERRLRTLDHLDILLAQLASKVEDNGGKVYFAQTAEDATSYISELANKHDVKHVVKGKSMTTHEIGLDQALEGMGIEVLETDLGEYIVQLAGDTPSHIIAPCIHMNKEQIADLFHEKLEMERSDDPETLTLEARNVLRKKMLAADMGITGCNLACAETGQISLVSNEGNIRMATTVPKVHVAVMGMERLVPTLKDHCDTVQLLTKSAAVQDISTYLSFIGAPETLDNGDGPQEFHLVIVDNGRSKILGDEDFKEILCCIRCGACLNACPVYGRIGGHSYNANYPGPIGAVISPLLEGVNKHADLCKGETLCGACKDICPVNNDIPRMLLALRKNLANGSEYWNVKKQSRVEGYGWSIFGYVTTKPGVYRTLLKIGRVALKPFGKKGGYIERMFGPAAGWTKNRDLPPMAERTFKERWQSRTRKSN